MARSGGVVAATAQRLLAGGDGVDVVLPAPQVELQGAQQRGVVVDDQDAAHAGLRQSHVHGQSAAGGLGGHQRAAHGPGEAVCDGQPEAQAPGGAVPEALVGREQRALPRRRDTGPAVDDGQDDLLSTLGRRHQHVGAPAAVPQGVVDQVGDDPLGQADVGADQRQVRRGRRRRRARCSDSPPSARPTISSTSTASSVTLSAPASRREVASRFATSDVQPVRRVLHGPAAAPRAPRRSTGRPAARRLRDAGLDPGQRRAQVMAHPGQQARCAAGPRSPAGPPQPPAPGAPGAPRRRPPPGRRRSAPAGRRR